LYADMSSGIILLHDADKQLVAELYEHDADEYAADGYNCNNKT